MNCKQIDELLPLYAGRDLDEKRARLVSEHIEICTACARVADEYRETVELAQHFAPPAFTDIAYARVRRQVMQQIENETTAPLVPQMFGSWFRPRMAWAVASGLIIVFGFALYLIVKRPGDVRQVAENHPVETEQTELTATPPKTNRESPGIAQKPAGDKRSRRNSVNRSPLVAAKAPGSSSQPAEIFPKLRDPEAANSLPADDATSGKAPLRVEMQTKDPNIRIIWFSQPHTKPAVPNAKGI
jgi:hypothetical protein